MYMGNRRGWYRGYMPRSYIPPNVFASFGCAICLIFFGIFFLLAGTIMMVFASKTEKPKPPFDDPFFAKDQTDIGKPFRIIAPILLSVGGIFILSTVIICCYAKRAYDKQQKKRQEQPQEQTTFVPPPPGSYPQQAGAYPMQPTPYSDYPNQQQQYPTGPAYPTPPQYSAGTSYPPPAQYPAPQYPAGAPYVAPPSAPNGNEPSAYPSSNIEKPPYPQPTN